MRPFRTVAYVDLILGSELVVLGRLLAGTPGLTKAEQVQLIGGLAVTREIVTFGGTTQLAWYNNRGDFLDYTDNLSHEDADKRVSEGCKPLGIYGNGPIGDGFKPGSGLPENWGSLLALAIDNELAALGEQKEMAGPPAGAPPTEAPISPLIVGIITAGVAATAIAGVAVWRALDPDYRAHLATIVEAGKAFSIRIQAFKDTGTMPPPSPIEMGAKTAVEKAADAGSKTGWVWTGAVAGGVVGATVAGGLIYRYASKGRAPDKRDIGA